MKIIMEIKVESEVNEERFKQALDASGKTREEYLEEVRIGLTEEMEDVLYDDDDFKRNELVVTVKEGN